MIRKNQKYITIPYHTIQNAAIIKRNVYTPINMITSLNFRFSSVSLVAKWKNATIEKFIRRSTAYPYDFQLFGSIIRLNSQKNFDKDTHDPFPK